MKSVFRLSGVAVLALPLGGCHSFLGIHFARHAAPEYRKLVKIDGASQAPATGTATAEGRNDLASGNPGAAVEAFQRALGLGEPIAPAANGLGVAYVQLGRADLARRFFEQAASVEPANQSYADNLVRLARSELVAAERSASAALDRDIATKASVAPSVVSQPALAQQRHGLQVVSPHEVRLVLAQPDLSGRTPLARAVAPSRFRPIIQITFAQRSAVAVPSPQRESVDRFRPLLRMALPASRQVARAGHVNRTIAFPKPDFEAKSQVSLRASKPVA